MIITNLLLPLGHISNNNMGWNANKKNMGFKKILKNYRMGWKLLEIMANGLYAVFHRFVG